MDTIKNLQQEINSLKKTNIKLKRKTSTNEDNYCSTLTTPTPTVARSLTAIFGKNKTLLILLKLLRATSKAARQNAPMV